MKKKQFRKFEESPPAKSALWQSLEWLTLVWVCWMAYKVLQKNPLHLAVFESILPVQTFFPTFSAIIFYIWNLFLWCGILCGCMTAGFYSLRLLKIQWKSALEQIVFSLSGGYGIVSLLILLLASLHILLKPVLIGVWVIGILGFFYCMKQEENKLVIINFFSQTGQAIFGNANPLIFRIFLWIFLGVSLMMTFIPELFYDSLVYHLGVPNLYLQEGGLVRIPGNTSRFPLLWQMLYVLGLALTDEMIPKLIHWSSSILLILACSSLALRVGFESWVGILSGLFFISVPMVQMNIWTTGIDIGSCLFAFLAIYAAMVWFNENFHFHWIIISAVMSGFAFGSKYQGGILAVTVFVLIAGFYFLKEPKKIKELFKISVLFGAVFILAILPWLLKNFWDTGNPLFPFLNGLFEKLGLQKELIDPEQHKHFIAENRKFLTLSWKEHLKLPWQLTFEAGGQSGLSFPGPLFLTFLPMIFVGFQKFREKWFQFGIGFILLFFSFAFSSTHLTRYHLQGYPLLCFFYAAGFSICWRGKPFFWKAILAVAASFIFLENLQNGIFIIQNSYRPWNVLSGRESREDYRSYTHSGLNPYPSNAMFRWMEKNLSPKSRTLFIGESKNFDLKLPYLYTDVHGQNPTVRWTEESKNPDELYEKFRQFGITHFLINFTEAQRTYGYKMIQWKKEELDKFKYFWEKHVREIHKEKIPEKLFAANSVILLYEILSEEEAIKKGGAQVNPLAILEEMSKQ